MLVLWGTGYVPPVLPVDYQGSLAKPAARQIIGEPLYNNDSNVANLFKEEQEELEGGALYLINGDNGGELIKRLETVLC